MDSSSPNTSLEPTPPIRDHSLLATMAAIVRTARPHQWIKNLFVAAPLVFARLIEDTAALARTGAAVACFCLLSSAVYFLNDLIDIEKDRAHPSKRNRPIASGALGIGTARTLIAALTTLALAAAFQLSPDFALIATGYFVLNIAYSMRLKRIPFVDVLCIAGGFLMRVQGGAAAISVEASPWLLGCTLLLASMLGFGKRTHELRVAGARGMQREVLSSYRLDVLRPLLYLLALATVSVYTAYTQSQHAQEFFETRLLSITIPFVTAGIGRFIWLVLRRADADSPTDSMLRDKWFLLNLVAYAAAILFAIYRTP